MSSSVASYFPGVFTRRNGNGAHEQISGASCDGFESCREDVGIPEAEISDEALILRLQEKDISALGLLYRRYARLIYSVCARTDQCVPLSRAEPCKQNEEELLACVTASHSDPTELLYQFRCLLEIPGRSKRFSSAMCLAAETAPLEAL
jgi:hypothetical protein